MRIASLLPSCTEIACALDLGSRLVGRSHECDHPPEVGRLPALTAPRFDPSGTSAAIDSRVRELVARGLSIYDVDAAALRRLAPDLILTQDQCAVCAASLADVEAAVAAWTGRAAKVLSLSPATLGDVLEDVRRVARAAGEPERGDRLVAALTERITSIGECTGSLERPGVACLEWLDPPMNAGHWLPELVALAGGEAQLANAGGRSERIDPGALAANDPDVILLLPCGFGLPRTREELAALARQPFWRELRAVREGRVFLCDGNALMNRPGPRLVTSLEVIAEILHPDATRELLREVPGGTHRGRYWEPAPPR